MPKVLVVATSRNTFGGISSVIKAHEKCSFWKSYSCKWLETHKDGNILFKLIKAIRAYFIAVFLIPQYSIVHIHLSEVPSAIRKIPIFLLSKLYRKKVIVHFHSFSPETTIGGKYKKLYLFLFSRADKVIVLSESWKKWVCEYLLIKEHVVVVYNPCRDIVDLSLGVEKENIILYAGALNERKGYRDLIKAFHQLAKKNPTWKLVLAGNGQVAEANKLAEELNISDQVETTGWITGKDKDLLFRKAKLFCLPSYAEGFPTAILDACSYGIPFIATPVGGIPDIIIDGKNGLLFTPGNIEELKEKLSLLISDASLRQTLGKASIELASNVFGLAKINREIEALYSSLLHP